MVGSDPNAPIAIVAGGGSLPGEVLASLAARGRDFVVIAIRGEADAEIEAFGPHWLDWGQIGRLLDILKSHHCREMVLIGSVTKRPDFRAVMPDLGALRRLPAIIAALVGGDDSVMKRVIGLFEREGLTIIAAQDVAPELLVPEGALTPAAPDAGAEADIALGRRVIKSIGEFDIGQAVVVSGGRVAAVEAAEGTDNMLKRCVELRKDGRLSWRGRRGVLVKCTKPAQELRTDLPAIGPRTVTLAAEAGLAGLAVEAGGVLIARRVETVDAATRAGLFILGLPANGDGGGG